MKPTIPVLSAAHHAERTVLTSPNPYVPAPAQILKIDELVSGTRLFELRFVDPKLAERFTFRPGQFIELSVLGVGEGPFSLPCSPSRRGVFQLGIRRAGVLTGYLFDHVGEGDTVGIRGPLGNGFPVELFEGQDVLLVAGGLGMVPLRGLLQYLIDYRERFGRIVLLYGSRDPSHVLFRRELESLSRTGSVEISLAVDAVRELPWNGHIGYVTDLLESTQCDVDRTMVAACGPPVFYKHMLTKLVAQGYGKERIFLNLERRMECGIGKCGHCAVGYTFTCLHGPVFTYWDAINLPELI